MNEIWKPVPNWPDYLVSNLGNAKKTNGKILKQTCNGNGYLRVSLIEGVGTGNGKKFPLAKSRKRTAKIYELVMEAFVGPKPEGHNINHKNGNKSDNTLENLEYVTYSQNTRHAIETGLINPRAKSNVKLDEGKVKLIRKMLADKKSHGEIAKEFNVSRPTITNIALNKVWKEKER